MKKILKPSVVLVILAAVFVFSGRVALADPISNPTHFDDTFWFFPPSSGGYTQESTDITPLVDGSPDGYYFSTQFYFQGDSKDFGGYLGLQTGGSTGNKLAIFSIWGATSSSGPGNNFSGTESGQPYYTSRISYPWVVNNTYVTSVNLSSKTSTSETWTATVTDQTTGVQTLIGNIVTPLSMGNLIGQFANFHERYSGPTASCSDLQESEVEFTDITANDGAVSPTSHENDVPKTACVGDYATQDISGGIETVIGGQLPLASSPAAPTQTPTAPSAPTKTTSTPPAAPTKSSPAATPVCPAHSFLGFPSWYEYLKLDSNCTPKLSSIFDIWLIVAAIVDILLRLAALAAIALVIYGAVQYITSQGSPDKTTKARTTIISALVGLVIAVLAVTLITFIAGQFKTS